MDVPQSNKPTLIKEMYNDFFSDNRNLTIMVLIILLLLIFSRIPLVETMSQVLYNIIYNLYNFIMDLIYSITYSTGEILNASSNTVTGVAKTSLDLGNGAVNNIGNLLSDTECQYRGNPVKPNQCQPPEMQPKIVYMTQRPIEKIVTVPVTVPVKQEETTPPSPTPKRLGKVKPMTTPPGFVPRTEPPTPPITAKPIIETPTVAKPVIYTPPRKELPPPTQKPVFLIQPPIKSNGDNLYNGEPLNYESSVFVDNPLNPDPYDKNSNMKIMNTVSLDNNPIKSSVNLDSVLEGLENRNMTSFEPDPAGSLTGTAKSKSAWCFIGEFDGKRSCVEIPPSTQGCQSGLMYSSAESCTANGQKSV